MKKKPFFFLQNERVLIDFFEMDKKTFLTTYQSVTEEDYNAIAKKITPVIHSYLDKIDTTMDILLISKARITKEKRICKKKCHDAYSKINAKNLLTKKDITNISTLDSANIYLREAEDAILKTIHLYTCANELIDYE